MQKQDKALRPTHPARLSLFLFLAVLVWCICLARAKGQPFRYYELKLDGVLAAALAPDGSYAALITRGKSGREPFDDLQIWDFRGHNLILERKARVWDIKPDQHGEIAQGNFHKSLAYTPDGQELVYCDGALAHIFNTSQYDEVRAFPLLPDKPSQARNMRISPNGKEIGVRIIKTDPDFYLHGGVLLNIYELASGVLKRSQKFESALDELGDSGIAWSADGAGLALILEPTHEQEYQHGLQETIGQFAELAIIRSDGREIRVRTEHWAGDVAFVGSESVVTVARETASGSNRKDGPRLWNAKTGKFLREIPSKPDGAHDHVEVSGDGRVLLAYVGKGRRNEASVSVAHEPRFRLWDTATWEVLFTSPPIPFAGKQFDSQEMQFALTSTGSVVMVWDSIEAGPIYFYEWR